MNDDPKKRFERAAEEINLNLGGLFGSLGDALNEMVSRLEDGKSGSVQRDHVFETPKGPVRAQTGIRVRMGGLDAGAAPKPARPINPDRKTPAQTAPRDLAYDLLDDDDGWLLTADLPGVTLKEVVLDASPEGLTITTTGKRSYRAEVALTGGFALADIKINLRNGILELKIPKAQQ